MTASSSHKLITISLRRLLGITLKRAMKADVKTIWNVEYSKPQALLFNHLEAPDDS